MNKSILSLSKVSKLTPFQKIALSFIFVIFIGAMLLMLPVSNHDGRWLSFVDAFFTATSATCVTGLVVVPTVVQFSVFGQLVILCLIQIGGLGLMTLIASFALRARKRLSLKNKLAMKEIYNHYNLTNIKGFLWGILRFTFACEVIGALFLLTQFIPRFGLAKGIFGSIFVSVSAFCNAGFDNITTDSLAIFIDNPIVNYVIMVLVVTGGVGFLVWFDVKDKLVPFIKRKISFRKFRHTLQLQTKMVILMTSVLIIVPALLIFMIEYDNLDTIGNLSFLEKITASLFASITLRTAGFSAFDMGLVAPATSFLMIITMFIGGSPGGTAGGVKTTTILVIVINVLSAVKGKMRTNLFRRHIPRTIIVHCLTILTINLAVLFIGIFGLLLVEPFTFLQSCFEAVSALATVGLSTGVTGLLSDIGKVIIIVLMFVGRIGIMTFILSLIKKETDSEIEYAEGHILIG
ncbi:MAG: TrkH family potassium uptake protein [Breznakia sp.]